MPLEVLTGPDVPALFARAQERLGDDAVVLSVRRVVQDGRRAFEMLASDPRTAELQRRETAARAGEAPAAPAGPHAGLPGALARTGGAPARSGAEPPFAWRQTSGADAPPTRPAAHPLERPVRPDGRRPSAAEARQPARSGAPAAPATPAAGAKRSRVIVLVGPTGGGKTTTIAKLANHPQAFGTRRTGLLCLDTYRIGAVDQLGHYGELSRLPFEVAWDTRDIARAARRLRDCEVILVDTAGRGPRASADLRDTQKRLLELLPDEVHLVLPAGLQRSLARRIVTAHLPLGVTHLLPTKLDEFPDEREAFDLASQFGLPIAWIADGQEVPRDLQRAELAPAVGARLALQDAA